MRLVQQNPLPLAGYGGIDRISNTDQKSLEANWIAFNISNKNYALLIGIDALFSSDALESKIHTHLKQLGILVGFMWVCASHTHFAPQLDPSKPRLGRSSEKHIDDVAKRIANSVAKNVSTQATRTSRISFGIENCNGAVFRRKLGWAFKLRFPFFVRSCKLAPNDDVKICRNLRAWVIEDQNQKPIVVFFALVLSRGSVI